MIFITGFTRTLDFLTFCFCTLELEAEESAPRKPNRVAIFTRIDSGKPESSGRPIMTRYEVMWQTRLYTKTLQKQCVRTCESEQPIYVRHLGETAVL